MNREDHIQPGASLDLYHQIRQLHNQLDSAFLETYQRSLPFNELLLDRWDRAQKLHFGEETSIYDTALVFGHPQVGMHCWIGPYTILDGSGGLTIGNYCTISAGVQIYTHDNVKQTLSSGKHPIDRKPVVIGNNVYIAPNTLITKGVSIGNYCVIGSASLVNKNIPDYSIVFGQPGRIVGKVRIEGNEIQLEYIKTQNDSQ